ncbi:MAG TPA: HIT domain-containing protein [Vicinamibacterales bacterium]
MDQLWSPWRLPYVKGVIEARPAVSCVFCHAPTEPQESSLVLHRGDHGFVILNRYPYNNGHLMVLPYRHVPSLTDLTPAELHEVADLTQRSEAVLTKAYAPHGINVGINLGLSAGAGLREHLHVHLVPRWTGDTNFMSVVGETRVLSEELSATVARLRPLWTSR